MGADDVQAKASESRLQDPRHPRLRRPARPPVQCQRVHSASELADIIVRQFKTNGDKIKPEQQQTPSYLLPARRPSLLDRRFEGTEKENEDYVLLTEKLKELRITHPDQITESIQAKILEDPRIEFHKKARRI